MIFGVGTRHRLPIALVLLGTATCVPSPDVPDGESSEQIVGWGRREIETPAGPDSLAPNLLVANGALILSWLEEVEGPPGVAGHRLLMSQLSSGRWSPQGKVAEGADFFANWADIPSVAIDAAGDLYAHWLAKTAADTYAYSIFLARSVDGGETWSPMGTLNDDATPTEHGFVSFVTQAEGVRAFWLDGRQMADGGAMNVRTALLDQEIGKSEVLDDRVCECCATDAVTTPQGPVVVFRDRSTDEIRDIGIARQMGNEWSQTRLVAADDWRIEGCPVNGPAIASSGERVAVAWFTAAGDGPKVQIAFSEDSGATFEASEVVDSGRPLGRVDLVEDGAGGFVLSWLEGADQLAEIRFRRFDRTGAGGEPVVVARTSPSRASGFPRLARIGSLLYLAWVDIEGEDSSQVRLEKIPISVLG